MLYEIAREYCFQLPCRDKYLGKEIQPFRTPVLLMRQEMLDIPEHLVCFQVFVNDARDTKKLAHIPSINHYHTDVPVNTIM